MFLIDDAKCHRKQLRTPNPAAKTRTTLTASVTQVMTIIIFSLLPTPTLSQAPPIHTGIGQLPQPVTQGFDNYTVLRNCIQSKQHVA